MISVRMILRSLLMLLGALCLTVIPAAQAGAVSFPLVSEGKPVATVVYAGDNADLIASVTDLRVYVKRISGADLDIRKQSGDLPGPTLHIGETDLYARTAALREKIVKDGFVIVPVGEDLVLAGSLPQGTSNGIITLLQDHFGVRWYWRGPAWEVAPENQNLTVEFTPNTGASAWLENPAFIKRHYWGGADRRHARRMRNTLPGVEFDFQGTSHDMGKVVPDSLFGEHPEYFALIDGRRTTDSQCFSHPDMFDLFMDYVRKGGRSFGLKDNGAVCQCERCAPIHKGSHDYNKYPNVSDTYFPLIKRVAEQTAKEFPGARIGTFVYQSTNMPPRGVDFLGENVDINLCIDTSQQFDAEYRALDRELVKKWPTLVGQASFYDYIGLSYWTPRYFPGLLADQMRYAADNNVIGYFSHTGAMPSSSMPMYYVYSQMMWNTQIDYRDSIDRMMDDLYVEAAAPMKAFYQHWEDCWMRPRTETSADFPNRNPPHNKARWLYGIDDFFGEMRLYTEADFEKGESLLLEAKALAKNKTVQSRVHDAWFEYRYSYLAAKTYFAAQTAINSEPAAPAEAYVLSASVNKAFRDFVFYYGFVKERPDNSASGWPGKTFFVRCWGLRAMLRDAALAPFVRWSLQHEGKVDPYVHRRFEESAVTQALWNRTDIEAQMAEDIGAQERRPRADGLRVADIPLLKKGRPDWETLPEIDAAPWLYEERPQNPKRGNYDDPHKYFYIAPPDPADHLVRMQGTWDKKRLHLRILVTDDVHKQEEAPEGMSRADSVRIVLVPDRGNYQYEEHSWTLIWGGYHGTEADFGIGLRDGKVMTHVWESPKSVKDSKAESYIDAEARREGNDTEYVVSVDWRLVPDFIPAAEKSLGIIVNVMDQDGDVLQVAEYGSGLTYGKRPSECSAIRLTQPD